MRALAAVGQSHGASAMIKTQTPVAVPACPLDLPAFVAFEGAASESG
jgi:hypothetical protein